MFEWLSQYFDPVLIYVVGVCSIILLVVVGGYVFMFLLIMKNDPREKEFRKKHNWKDTLIPHKYKDEEDTNDTTDFNLLYRKNRFKVCDVDFSFEELPKTDFFATPFAILTAWNPDNQSTARSINTKNNNLLEYDLKNLKYSFVKAVGYLDNHSEESFCVYNISFDQAINLAKNFHQYSIFYNNANTFGYYEVETSKVIIERDL